MNKEIERFRASDLRDRIYEVVVMQQFERLDTADGTRLRTGARRLELADGSRVDERYDGSFVIDESRVVIRRMPAA